MNGMGAEKYGGTIGSDASEKNERKNEYLEPNSYGDQRQTAPAPATRVTPATSKAFVRLTGSLATNLDNLKHRVNVL
jgi:hypothetical protein